MSQVIRVYLNGSRLPDVAVWQAGLTAHGFAFVLDPSVSLPTHEGYLPVTCEGIETGFEFYLDPVSTAELAGGRDQSATFRWGSDPHALVAASACAAVLTALTDGVFFDAEGGEVVPAEQALADARATRDEGLWPADLPPVSPPKPWWKFW
ncbi:MAG: hypothetical protein V4850_22590 [Myxococcota bacterium]